MRTSWEEKIGGREYPALSVDTHADIAIIGGGMAGILIAYTLARAGKKVVVLEKGTIGDGVTHQTTAFITQVIDSSLVELTKMFGSESARMIWLSGAKAIDTIEEIVEREHIECDFSRCPAYVFARSRHQLTGLELEASLAKHLGFHTEILTDKHLPFKQSGSLHIARQAKFQPLTFLHAVAAAAVSAGAQIFEKTEVTQLSEEGPVVVTTHNGSKVTAHDAIVATYLPFNRPKVNRFKKAMYRSYVIEAHLSHTDLPAALYWDQSNPYTYFRVDHQAPGSRIILGGADHRADIPLIASRNFHALERYLADITGSKPAHITRRWTGPVLESVDGLPFIGTYAPHRHMASAFSGNGMTYSVVAAGLFHDLLLGKDNPWVKLYDPKRSIGLYTLYRKGMDYGERFFGSAKNMLRG